MSRCFEVGVCDRGGVLITFFAVFAGARASAIRSAILLEYEETSRWTTFDCCGDTGSASDSELVEDAESASDSELVVSTSLSVPESEREDSS